MTIDVAALSEALSGHGLRLRGGLSFSTVEDAPLLSSGAPAVGLVLIGPAGGSLWPAFSAWHADHPLLDHPLDSWSKAVVGPIAAQFSATAWYPSDPPYQPFQRWARAAEGLEASPLGILAHPTFGLWHSYRAALGFSTPWPEPAPPPPPHPCSTCADKPCLTQCPAHAVALGHFDVPRCRTHLASPEGRTGCQSHGCHARNACPIGRNHRYPLEQLRFHMAAMSA